jgi:hypothetical protein
MTYTLLFATERGMKGLQPMLARVDSCLNAHRASTPQWRESGSSLPGSAHSMSSHDYRTQGE